MNRPVLLTIAGSDSGGGAGIQADLRTFSRLGTFGTTVITALTAQNLTGVRHVVPTPLDGIAAQLDAVFDGFKVAAVKTGMLWSREIVELVARRKREMPGVDWVIDPVMVATSGSRLLQEDAVRAYRELLMPGARVVTPNLDEAAVLLDVQSVRREEMADAARELERRLGAAVLLKGGHLDGDPLDVLAGGGTLHLWEHQRFREVNTHGTGCMLSAAVAALLGRGLQLPQACAGALEFLAEALHEPWPIGIGAKLAGIEAASDRGGALPFVREISAL